MTEKHMKKARYMPNIALDVILVLIPIIGMLLKNMCYLGFVLGDNYYQINFSSAIERGAANYFVTQLGVIVLLLVPAVFFRKKGKYWYLLIVDFLFSLIAFIDVCYVRYFNDLPSISMLTIVNPSSDSVASSGNVLFPVIWTDLLFLTDFVLWFVIFITDYAVKKKKKKIRISKRTYSAPKRAVAFAAVSVVCIAALSIIPILSSVSGNTDTYDSSYGTHDARAKAVAFTPLGYHMYDIANTIIPKKIDPEAQALIDGYFEWNNSDYYIDDTYYAKFEGKNVVVLQLESFESFLVGNSLDGQELTPVLNSLLGKSYYFCNIYDQAACGNSSDCDLMVNTSLYPAGSVSAYNFFSTNTFNSTPKILAANGYKTAYFNSLKNSAWNYYPMNKDAMQFEINDYEFDKSDKIYQYISDRSYLEQLADKIIALQKDNTAPIYAHTSTDSSHGPFRLPTECNTLELNDVIAGNVLGDYLQAVHYTDACLGYFLEKMSASPEYNNTVFVFMGDHRGIHKYYPQKLNELSDEELPSFVKRNFDAGIPLMIFDPSAEEGSGEIIDTFGGQIDLAPTLLYLLGVDHSYYKDTFMGRVLLATTRDCTYSSEQIMRGNPTEEDEKWFKLAYYLSDLMLKTDYFKK